MPATNANLALARRYLDALGQNVSNEALAAFFTEDVEQIELPNLLNPQGARRDLAAMLEAADRGRLAVSKQHYEVLNAVAEGESVALEVQWTATLRIPLGALAAGGELRAQFAVFMEFRDGKIARQRNYDCFEPF